MLVAIVAGVVVTSRASASSAFVPLALARATPRAAPPAVRADIERSVVLADVPVPPGARLDFFEAGRAGDQAPPVAWYAVGADAPSALGDWYRSVLAPEGWWLVGEVGGVQRWRRASQWLEIWLPGTGDERWLRLAREAGARVPRAERTIDRAILLPPDGLRWRFDRADLLTEEVRFSLPPEALGARLDASLTLQGWRLARVGTLADRELLLYVRASDVVALRVTGTPDGGSEAAFGAIDCLDARAVRAADAVAPSTVYLDGVPAPPDSAVSSYDYSAGADVAVERWRAGCADLDAIEHELSARQADEGWSVVDASRERRPGALRWRTVPTGGAPAVAVEVRPLAAGGAEVALTRAGGGRRVPRGRSLLFDDLVLPTGAEAITLATSASAAWSFDETYRVAQHAPGALGTFFRRAMPSDGWRLDRTLPGLFADDPVFARDGEEVRIALGRRTDGAAAVGIQRRRLCRDGAPQPLVGAPAPARHVAEVPVAPGAAYDGFDDLRERYRLVCSSLDDLAHWYRREMEAGRWALAVTEGPDDPYARRLLFVRPDELGRKPEARTAWADIWLSRPWPYQFVVVLARDPSGALATPTPP